MKDIWKEFKEFAIKGNAIDLAVGIVIGAAFNQVVNSFVTDVINPILSMFTGHIYFANIKLVIFHHVINLGTFFNTIINFFIVAFAVFLLIKQINRFRREPGEAPHTKECPYCKSAVDKQASRCPHCTSQLN
jgi:large conductance mechanosensitive channel